MRARQVRQRPVDDQTTAASTAKHQAAVVLHHRQPHQEPQKKRRARFPRRSRTPIWLPRRSGNSKSGSGLPICKSGTLVQAASVVILQSSQILGPSSRGETVAGRSLGVHRAHR